MSAQHARDAVACPYASRHRPGAGADARLRMAGRRNAIRFGLPLSGTRKTEIRIVRSKGRIAHLAVEESFIVF